MEIVKFYFIELFSRTRDNRPEPKANLLPGPVKTKPSTRKIIDFTIPQLFKHLPDFQPLCFAF